MSARVLDESSENYSTADRLRKILKMGLIPEDIISQVLDRSDIVEVISSYVPLKKTGKNFKACCPFHNEKTPSFVVNPDKQIFHCFGCGVGGNVVSFVMKQDKMEFPEAIRLLAKRVNVLVPDAGPANGHTANERQLIFKVNELVVEYFHNILLTGKNKEAKMARSYLKKRGVSLETVKEFKLGFALDEWEGLLDFLRNKNISFYLMEKAGLIISRDNKEGYYDRFRNRLIFPIFDTRNHCRAFGARALEETKGAKYINSPETLVYTKGHHLYGFHLTKEAISQEDSVIVVEGYTDCILPYQSGVLNVVASLGTALTTEQIRLIRRYTRNVVMLFDMDEAGKSAMLRSLDSFVEEGMHVKVAELEKGEDPDSYIRKFGLASFQQRVKEAKGLFDYKLLYLMETNDVRSIEGKSKIATEMLLTINKFENAVIKSEYLSRLAKRIVVSEQALAFELSRIDKTKLNRKEQLVLRQKVVHESPRAVEYHLLKLLLEEDKYVARTKEEIPVSDFQDMRIRNIISKVYEMFENDQRVDVGKLINSVEDSNTQEMISSIVADDTKISGDKEKMHQDYIHRLKNDKLKMRRKDLLLELSRAESTGDDVKLELLKKEFNSLSKINMGR